MEASPKPGLFDALIRYGFGARRGIPSLDGIRAFALPLVLIAHLSGTRGFVNWHPLYRLGTFGLRIFFVLSGYLITTILLNELRRTNRISLGRFYFRRSMRVFPAAYLLIGVTSLLVMNGIVHVKDHELLYASTYTMNLHEDRGWPLGHLWSMAVEEQFYFLWPAALMFLGQARSARVLIGVLIGAPLIRVVSPLLGPVANPSGFLFWSDSLASGCLLAMLSQNLIGRTWYARILASRWFFLVPVTGLAANFVPFTKVSWLVGYTTMNLAIALSLDWAIRNSDTLLGRVLNWPSVSFIGVISYSVYLWQQLFLDRESSSSVFPLNVTLAIAAGLVSYLLIEAPMLRLRARLERRWWTKPQAAIDSVIPITVAHEPVYAANPAQQSAFEAGNPSELSISVPRVQDHAARLVNE
jgi:peptidoglycan/LPS O-acetylase OafA/YrhL